AEAARLISDIENRPATVRPVMAHLFRRCGSAHLVGVTGPPGAGKSTLVAALVKEMRAKDLQVGVVAVDPSSPFSGGAVLGDRDRMSDFTLDRGVFIRSLAARGAGGGLAAAVSDAVDVMDAMGKDVVIVETVGVGQGELDIARLAQTVVLVLVPGYGDSLQAMKAGILEIADVIVVNKGDTPGAEQSAKELANQDYVRRGPEGAEPWVVPVVLASARRHEGIDDLARALAEHRAYAESSGAAAAARRQRRTAQFLERTAQRLRDELARALEGTPLMARTVERLEAGEVDPDGAADEVIEQLGWRRAPASPAPGRD
ncbi:MAG: methylmalonyl Co-A mutase-associated GTPase MeaB, partial [Acidimicrobiia bacterium]